MDNNVRKLIIINPEVLRIAKAIYKGGKFEFSADSAFVRDVFQEIANKVKKSVRK
jgi:hypothetical protein